MLVASVAAALAWGVATRRWPCARGVARRGLERRAASRCCRGCPLPLPAARFVWLGPLAWLAWVGAIATGVACAHRGRAGVAAGSRVDGDRRRGGWLAGGARARAVRVRLRVRAHRILPGGDEPHYLVIAESLRRDGDLAIDDNHERGDYLAFFRGELAPDYLRRGVDRRIYSIHAPGLPVLVLPAYAAFGYAGVVAALLIASAWGAALLWRLVLDVTADAGAAWFAWAAAVLASPILFHTFTVFPDGVAGDRGAVGVRGLAEIAGARRDRDPSAPASWATLVTSGAALAVLPWLHTRAAVIAAALGLAIVATAIWRRTPWPRIAAFAIVPMLSAAGWFGYFLRVYGTLDPVGAVRRLHADRVGAPAGRPRRAAPGRAVRRARRRAGVRAGARSASRGWLMGDAHSRPRSGRLDGRGPDRRASRSPPPSSATPSPRRRTGCGGAAPARRRASWCRCCCRWRSRSASRGAGRVAWLSGAWRRARWPSPRSSSRPRSR